MALISGRTKLIAWLAAILTVAGVMGGVAFSHPFRGKSARLSGSTASLPPLPVKRETFLVMGVDKRPDDTGRSDSMMVVSYAPDQQQFAIYSLQRDTWTMIPGHGYDKVNHSYAFGGDALAVKAVEELLGIPIDHYVTLSFQGFARLVDALGGVDIDAEKQMDYEDPSDLGMGPKGLIIHIRKGQQHMDGLTALKYARFRHDDEGDFGRMRRQQQVAKALMKQAARPGIVGKIPQLIPALNDAIDTDLSVAEMIKLATSAKEGLTNPLKTGSSGGDEKIMDGIYYMIPNLVDERRKAYQVLVGGEPPDNFMQRAQEDEATYRKALAEATADEQPAAPRPADSKGSSAVPPKTSPGGTAEKGTGSGSPTTPPESTNPPVTPPPKSQPITITVIDASGANLGPEYVKKLTDAGFRVAGRLTSKPISQTVALDHAGQPGTAERIHAILPNAVILSEPDSRADVAIEIVLGTDLAPKKP